MQIPVKPLDIPDVIASAATSTLGIIALVVIAIAALALAFFQKESAKIKSSMFVVMLVGAGLMVTAMVRAPANGNERVVPGSTAGSAPDTLLPQSSTAVDSNARNVTSPPIAVTVPSRDEVYEMQKGGDWEGALRGWSTRIERYPQEHYNYYQRSAVYREMGDALKAVADLDRVITIAPNHTYALNNRGLLKVELGQKEEGCDDLRMAADLGHDRATGNYEARCS